jgi:hypothetical protein
LAVWWEGSPNHRNARGFSHTLPADANILLASPGNKRAVMLMSGGGGATLVSNLRLTFDDRGTPVLTR